MLYIALEVLMGGMGWLGVAIALAVAACSNGSGGSDNGSCGNSSSGGIFGGQGSGAGATCGGSSSSGATGGQCGPSTGSQTCDQCVARTCCDMGKACNTGSDCASLYDCVASCNGDSTCSDSCIQRYPNGRAPLQSILNCLDQSCKGAC